MRKVLLKLKLFHLLLNGRSDLALKETLERSIRQPGNLLPKPSFSDLILILFLRDSQDRKQNTQSDRFLNA